MEEKVMKNVKEGDTVQILFEAKLDTGEFCYKNDADNLTEVVIGEGKFFPVIEQALCSMAEGESKEVTLEAEDAFGPHLDNLVIKIPKSMVQTDVTLEVGSRVKIDAPTGNSYVGTIVDIEDQTFTLDLNHLLAGKRLVIKFTVVSITEQLNQ